VDCFDPVRACWFNVSLWVAPYRCRDGSGDPKYGDQIEIKGYHVRKHQKFLTPDGNEVDVSDVIYTDQEINELDAVWLPGTDKAKRDDAQVIKSVSVTPSPSGSYRMYEAML
jgi:hypothetical protein